MGTNSEGVFHGKMHYRRMDEGTDEDFAVLRHVHEQTLRAVPDRLFAMLGELRQDTAYNITRYDHCLQAATRALRDNKDDEYVAVALLHDVCEPLGPFNHGEVVASILRPFISRDNHWMLVQHGLFQTYFYARHMGLDPNRATSTNLIRRMSRRSSSAPNTTKYPSTPTTRTSRYRPSSRWSAACFRNRGSPHRRCRRPSRR